MVTFLVTPMVSVIVTLMVTLVFSKPHTAPYGNFRGILESRHCLGRRSKQICGALGGLRLRGALCPEEVLGRKAEG